MDPTLTTAEAHVLFGKLYRKPRSPELQKKVEEIVSSTSDVYVRIKRIEELDAQEDKKNRRNIETKEGPKRRRPSRGGGGALPPSSANKAKASKKKKVGPKPAKKGGGGGGFFARLFGTELSRWGASNGVLDGGFFARNPTLSPRIKDRFGQLTDLQIKGALAGFRGSLGVLWEVLEPARYNVLIAAYQFLIEFVKTETAFLHQSDPSDLNTATLRLQKSYAQLISFPNYARVLQEDFPKILSESEKLRSHVHATQGVMDYIVGLDQAKPTLRHIFQALYSLERNKVVSWDEIARGLGVGTPDTNKYRAPEAVLEAIHKKARTLKMQMKQYEAEIAEARQIQKEYLKVDANGKLDVAFLDPIIQDVLRRIFHDQKMTANLQRSYKTEPQKLLYCILKDIELNLIILLTSSVMTKEPGMHSEEVQVFKPVLLSKQVSLFQQSFRNIEDFVKKHKDMEYSFNDYLRHLKEPAQKTEHREFLELAKTALAVLGKLALPLKTVVQNHEEAVEAERFGKAEEKVLATKSLPIDSLNSGARFIPWARREIAASSRMNGQTIEDVLRDYVKFMYNYLYIFRDPAIGTAINSIPSKLKAIEKIKVELQRMGISSGSD